MPNRLPAAPILRSKLYRPPVAADLVDREELRARLAGGVDSLTLAGLRKDCKDRDLAVSGTKGKLFERLQGYLDDGGHAPRRKRRRR